MNFDEVMVHAQVMPDEYRTESPTASPPAENSGKVKAKVCTTEVCFLGKSNTS